MSSEIVLVPFRGDTLEAVRRDGEVWISLRRLCECLGLNRERFGDGADREYSRRRLDWLVWWTRWALDNCRYPTFVNS